MIEDAVYRCPRDLELTWPPPIKALVIGSCLVSEWAAQAGGDYIPFAGVSRLPDPPAEIADYDFQIVQLNLRHFLPESAYFRLRYDDYVSHEELFENTRLAMLANLEAAMRLNAEHGLLTFVTNFMLPQANPTGRLLPRYDLRNPVYFIQKLNKALAIWLEANYTSAYLLDVDEIVATFGRRYFQDDAAWAWTHGGALNDFDFERDLERIEPPTAPMTELYGTRQRQFIDAFWAEAVAMWRTVRQIDQVKLVIVDLDDTLWRGVAAESLSNDAMEGWPLGFLEALAYLKKRGVLLAIVSKNDEHKATVIWHSLASERRLALSLDDFVSRKINWEPKPDNIAEILAETNLLPKSVVFIDDNPVERAFVRATFPDMRILGADPYVLRRILLWAPEMQVATVTDESGHRTEMVQAQIERESVRSTMTSDEFLASLAVVFSVHRIESSSDEHFPRALELLNKTNQFNTTSRRWGAHELDECFYRGGYLLAYDISDRFTGYGIAAVAIVAESTLVQFAMSCRIFGLGIETGVVTATLRDAGVTQARYTETVANQICRGFVEAFTRID